MGKARTVYIISHTHWDREWYITREQFRLMLVDLIDGLLDMLDQADDFKAFMLDGQAIIIEDYLSLRPEKEEKLKKYINDGRILIGPWYVLPDELLISAESHIRNYIMGDYVCKKMGKKMNVGYLPDAFGHPSQMPQILRGLGMEEIIFWRGAPPEIDSVEFIWVAPDGSQVLAVNMPYSYGIAANLPKDKEHFIRRLKNEIGKIEPLSKSGIMLLMNGVDHLAPQPHIPALLKAVEKDFPGYNLIHGTLPDYVSALKAHLPELERYAGELRFTKKAYLLGGTISTRMYIKQAAYKTSCLLENYVEPIATIASIHGRRYPQGEIREAWRYALSNMAHDSICGCSVDSVHDEMMGRYKILEELEEGIVHSCASYIANNIKCDIEDKDGALVVFNTLLTPRTDIVKTTITYDARLLRRVDFDKGELVEYGRQKERVLPTGIEVYDMHGRRIECQLDNVRLEDIMQLSLDDQPHMYEAVRCDVTFIARDVRPMGYEVYLFKFTFGNTFDEQCCNAADYCIENEYLRVVPNAENGTIDIYDKVSGKVYKGCNAFVDDGDAGDEYTYSPPQENKVYSLDPSTVKIEKVESGPTRYSIAISGVLNIPSEISPDRKSRSSNFVRNPITSIVSLYPGIKRVDITTKVENNARDHRLRVLFPTGVKASFSWAEGPFSVDARPVTPVGGWKVGDDWMEAPCTTHPQKSFVDVNDGQFGLAVANRGLPEFEAYDDGDQTVIALTLLRCVGWLSRPDLITRKGNGGWTLPTPGAQCLGSHVFEYSIIPHSGSWKEGGVDLEAHNFNVPLKAVQKEKDGKALPLSYTAVNASCSCIKMSALKRAEDGKGIIVRMYNMSDGAVESRIVFGFDVSYAAQTDMAENNHVPITLDDRSVVLKFRPWEVKTLYVTPDKTIL